MKQYNLFISFLCGVFCFTLLSIFFTNTASAQGAGNFNVRLTPPFPGPSEVVTAEVISNLINVNTTPITWLLNRKIRLQGVGKSSFTFKTGEVGSVTLFRVEVTTEQVGVVAKDIEIRPSDVDILWEADTYTPPFYKGRALPTSKSYIKMVGIPHFVATSGKVAPENLVYQWKKTYTPNPNDSGLGKNTYLYRGGYSLNEDVVDTVISTADNKISVSKKTKISIREPKIVFYERRPLEGVRYENFLGGSFDLKEKELTLRAEPYFFSFSNADNNSADFTWQLDGKKLETDPDKKSEFTLRKPENGSGRAGITLKIENTRYDLQSASKNISLSYTN